MPDEPVIAIAPIPLARSRGRLLLLPLVLLLASAAGAGAAMLFLQAWQLAVALTGAAVVAVVGAYLALVVLTVRVDVEVSTLRIRWLGADRRFALARGAVTRVPLSGERAARLRPRFGFLGWGLGRARLRGTETIYLVRLARTGALIVVPTESGRVALAPRSEQQLIEALGAAARVQQRLDQVTLRARSVPVEQVVEPPPPPPPAEEPAPRMLTGIERTLLEERLAAERAAALAAAEAEAERRRSEEAVRAAAAVQSEVPEAARPVRATRQRPRVGRLGWPRVPRPALHAPRVRGLPASRMMSLAVCALPLATALVVWGLGRFAWGLETALHPQQETALGLALAGPGAALAALAARQWFPRLVGLVTVTSLCTLALLARALLG